MNRILLILIYSTRILGLASVAWGWLRERSKFPEWMGGWW